jgi:hypothetical protein
VTGGLLLGLCFDGSSEHRRLVLEEISSVSLPARSVFVGLSRGGDGAIVVWGTEPSVVLRYDTALALDKEWRLPPNLRPLAAWSGSGGLEIVTSEPAGIHFIGEGGTRLGSEPLAAEGTILEAARGREGWYLLMEDTEAGALLVRGPGGRTSRRAPSYGGLTVDNRGMVERVWLTQFRYPFAIFDLTGGDQTKAAMQPDGPMLDSLLSVFGAEGSPRWASLPIVVLEVGFLQTLVDLSGDRRVFIVYGPGGEVSSVTSIDVPLGLVASATDLPVLYGARQTDGLELVRYSYRSARGSFTLEGVPDDGQD